MRPCAVCNCWAYHPDRLCYAHQKDVDLKREAERRNVPKSVPTRMLTDEQREMVGALRVMGVSEEMIRVAVARAMGGGT